MTERMFVRHLRRDNVMTQGAIEIRYRPAVDVESADDLVDVQELLLVLEQEGGPVRLAEIGRKRLPPPDDDGASPNWGHVRRVVEQRDQLDEVLDGWTYETRTQGTRHQSATRVAARGTWVIDGEARDTRLVLGRQPELDDRQLLDQLGIEETASYRINAKNPRAGGDTGLDAEERARYPDDLQAAFDGNRWAGVDPIELLDHEGAEFLLIPAAD
jgi:hypothetical protein